MDRDQQRIAREEAGHACAAVILGATVVEVDIGDIRTADEAEVFRFYLLLQILRNQALQNLLADFTLKLLPDQGSGSLAGTKPGQFGALLDVGDYTGGFAFNFSRRNGNLQRVLAPFY